MFRRSAQIFSQLQRFRQTAFCGVGIVRTIVQNAETKEVPKKPLIRKQKKKRDRVAKDFYKQLDNEMGESIQVNCIPLAENIDLEALQSDDLFTLQFHINQLAPDAENIAIRCQYINDKTSQRIALAGEDVAENQEQSSFHSPLISEFYVFSDGVVTFWNVDHHKQEHVIAHLKRFQMLPFGEHLSRLEEEKMNIEFIVGNSTANDNTIYLNIEAEKSPGSQPLTLSSSSFDSQNQQLERFAFSHALAASVRMGIWERELEELNDELENCIDRLKEGKLTWDGKKARKVIGQIASIRHSVNCTELLDKDIYWDLSEIERVYASLEKRLKLQFRQRELNKRIDYCEYFSKTVHEMHDQKHSHFLEWIIIVLISLEVIVNGQKLMEMFSGLWLLLPRWSSKKSINKNEKES